jgi:hypothetical protein
MNYKNKKEVQTGEGLEFYLGDIQNKCAAKEDE